MFTFFAPSAPVCRTIVFPKLKQLHASITFVVRNTFSFLRIINHYTVSVQKADKNFHWDVKKHINKMMPKIAKLKICIGAAH